LPSANQATIHRRLTLCSPEITSADPAAFQTLRELIPEFFYSRDAAHRLSLQIMVRRGQAWSLFEKN
jgi:hypothetical protein